MSPPASRAALSNLQKLEARGRDGPIQKEVLIAWDVENARAPEGVSLEDVEKAITNAFQYLQRRKRSGFLCAVSPESLETMTRVYGRDQVGYLTQHTDIRLAPGGAKSKSTDTKIIKEIEAFIAASLASGKAQNSVLVVITGDDDYTESIRRAMDAGMDVEVLHPEGRTSNNLLTAIRGRANVWHHDWMGFLDYWLWTHHGVKLPSADAASGEGGRGAWKRQPPHQQRERQQSPQQRQPPPPHHQHQGSGDGRPNSGKTRKGSAWGGGACSQKSGYGSKENRSRRGGGGGAQTDGGSCAGARVANWPAGPEEASPAKTGEESDPSSGATGGGGDGRGGVKARGERVSASLRLDSLPTVRESDAPERLLTGARTWFMEERRAKSEFYLKLQAIVSEAGCKLLVGEEPQAVGELYVVCVDEDEPYPHRAVETTRDELSRAINDRLSLAVKAMGPLFGTRPPPQPPPRAGQPQPDGATTPCSCCGWAQLDMFMEDRGVDTAGVLDRGQLLPMTNAVLVVESALGLANTPLADGRLLVAVPARDVGARFPELETAAARDMLGRRMSTPQLAAAARAAGVTVPAGTEKRCVAEMLAAKVLQQRYWTGNSSSSPGKG